MTRSGYLAQGSRLCALLCASLICGCSGPAPSVHSTKQPVASISALSRGRKVDTISYSGHWEFVKRRDGRFHGTSARSFHVGDSAAFVVKGSRVRIYGVTGPNGGRAELVVSGRPAQVISFYSPSKRIHQLMYDSGPLKGEVQSGALVVVTAGRGAANGYVNIEEIQSMGT